MSALMARLPVPLRFALRELRGGVKGFYVFLACLALGVAAVAAVGSVRLAISEGLAREGRAILGGDAEVEFTYRFPEPAERAWLHARTQAVSETVDFRSMVVADSPLTGQVERGLTQVRSVDAAYPLVGAVELSPPMALEEALGERDGRWGVALEPLLIERLGVAVGDAVRLGAQTYELRAAIDRVPDAAAGGLGLGPRTLVLTEALEGSQLLSPGSLYETEVRLALAPGDDPAALGRAFAQDFPDAGARWRDRSDPAPGVQRFVDRIGAFLILVGLAALAVGGVGVAAAVRSYLDEKTATIATLKTLGATGRTIFAVYLAQIGALAALGVAIGLLLGGVGPALIGPIFADSLPVPALFSIYARPMLEAALYGVLTALAFALWPLARAREVRAAALFRDVADPLKGWPATRDLLAIAALAALLVGSAVALSGAWLFAAWFAAGAIAALVVLWLAAQGLRRAALWGARRRAMRGRPALRLALASLAGPGGETVGAALSLGLGLTVLAAIGQVDHNLRQLVADELPSRSPAFFFVDIQNDQLGRFLETVERERVDSVETAPMLRGVVTRLDGVPAAEAEIDPDAAWVLRGDRGVSYAAARPEGAELTEGAWWAADYAGPPLVSFSDEHGRQLGLELGDTITVNVLGREITATVANFRRVDFRDMGINFLMILDPGAFQGAPHTHIATVYAPREAEGALLRAVGGAFANVTAVSVRDAITRVSDGLGQLAAAARWGAGVTLLTGLVVLIGAAAAGARRRTYEAAVLKTLGAARGRILASFALRAGLTGAAAGVVALAFGALAAWAVIVFVMDAAFSFSAASALAVVVGGALASLLAGLAFAWGPLSARPARVLRARE
ncbi:ABC transporter permease [Rubrimonas cliftonensis]|uniref:Putative ABC transport system permease protein n=1 Tax=Rubrimonas cliftonensis TaxID=89524 RepID=A0A1H3Z2L6_9RHOB|nr:FtsX-like permease family protein [Rubrimonas cliftonensis]SEA17698.1 putative ABC transport system permease protein [Rubrimonas cliftonensis]